MSSSTKKKWDAFISHASEDKDTFVRPLALALRSLGARIWYDEFSLRLGDSLSSSIDKGLEKSGYGIVVISPAFIRKPWPQRELQGLVTKEVNGRSCILPIWHDVTKVEVSLFSPTLADKVAVRTSDASAIDIALQILGQVRPDIYRRHPRAELVKRANGEALATLETQLNKLIYEIAEMRHALRSALQGVIGHIYAAREFYDSSLMAYQKGDTPLAVHLLLGSAHFRKSMNRALLCSEEVNTTFDNSQIQIGGLGKERLQRSKVNISGMLRELRIPYMPELVRRRLSVRDESREDVFAFCDVRLMRTAIFNLLDNAVKYSYSENLITMQAANFGSHVAVTISNIGPYIEPMIRESIFQPFHRVALRGLQPIPGTGLGLSVTKKIAEIHGGQIEVVSRSIGTEESNRAETTFTLRIPRGEQ